MTIKRLAASLASILALGICGASGAATINLTYELDGVEPEQTYATVEITQNGDDLDFTVNYVGGIGGNADIHELYFNIVDSATITGLAIVSDDAPNSSYSLLGPDPSVAGGAGSSFDWGVSFGNGGGPPGNGILQSASFTLSADQPLLISYLYETSATNNTAPINVAVHFQNTSTNPGSETIGGVVIPLPASLWMLMAGIGALGALRQRA